MIDRWHQTGPDFSTDHILAPWHGHQRSITAEVAEHTLRFRRHRDKVFGSLRLFNDPAWDILLEIYRSSARGMAVTVSDTASCSGIASSSATRWIRILEGAGLVHRNDDPDDRRRVMLSLTSTGSALMEQALAAWLPGARPQPEPTPKSVPIFFSAEAQADVDANAFASLRTMADRIHSSQLSGLVIRCLAEFEKWEAVPDATRMSNQIDVEIERMLGIGAYESAVLLIGRTFVRSWTPCFAKGARHRAIPTSCELGLALLRDLLDHVISRPAALVAG